MSTLLTSPHDPLVHSKSCLSLPNHLIPKPTSGCVSCTGCPATSHLLPWHHRAFLALCVLSKAPSIRHKLQEMFYTSHTIPFLGLDALLSARLHPVQFWLAWEKSGSLFGQADSGICIEPEWSIWQGSPYTIVSNTPQYRWALNLSPTKTEAEAKQTKENPWGL